MCSVRCNFKYGVYIMYVVMKKRNANSDLALYLYTYIWSKRLDFKFWCKQALLSLIIGVRVTACKTKFPHSCYIDYMKVKKK